MNLGRSEHQRLVQKEVQLNRIIALSQWIDECLVMLSIITNGTNVNAYNDIIDTLDEAYTEFWKYIAEIKA